MVSWFPHPSPRALKPRNPKECSDRPDPFPPRSRVDPILTIAAKQQSTDGIDRPTDQHLDTHSIRSKPADKLDDEKEIFAWTKVPPIDTICLRMSGSKIPASKMLESDKYDVLEKIGGFLCFFPLSSVFNRSHTRTDTLSTHQAMARLESSGRCAERSTT